ncbi:hypothetical protein HDU91_004847 [Kappamyces sp. JEL0680]|nr:hypothetical protein HDU91_004847 [Kappamyces sp. JEL0680]
MKKVTAVHKEWELYLASEEAALATATMTTKPASLRAPSLSRDSIDTSGSGNSEKPLGKASAAKKSEKKGFWKGIFRKEEKFEWKASRECMVQVLQTPKLYAELQTFVKERHCEENLVCYESFVKLESRTRIRPESSIPPCLERFLENAGQAASGASHEEEGEQPVPLSLAPLYLFFHQMFIVPESPFEINVTSGMRKEIDGKLKNIRNQMVTINVFDHCIDHVIELLYQNSFVNLVKAKSSSHI